MNDNYEELEKRLDEYIEQIIKASEMDKEMKERDSAIDEAMNNMYHFLQTCPKSFYAQMGIQFKVCDAERYLIRDYLPINTKPIYDPKDSPKEPEKLVSGQDCEQMMKSIVHLTREELSKNHDLETDSLEACCMNTTSEVKRICEEKNVDYIELGVDRDLSQGPFHIFNIVDLKTENGEHKFYLVDCTYRQFFLRCCSNLERIPVTMNQNRGCSIGRYMMMTKERRKMAEELLTKGYVEATPQNLKTYFDAIIFSGRDGEFYKSHGLDYKNPKDLIPEYSLTDYAKMLVDRRFVPENSPFLRQFKEESKSMLRRIKDAIEKARTMLEQNSRLT